MKRKDAEAEAILELSRLCKVFNLTGYTFTVETARKHGSLQAQVFCTEGQRDFTVELGKRYRKLTPRQRRHVLLHEVLHVTHRDMTDVMRLGLVHTSMEQGEYETLWECFRQQQFELWTDGMTRVLEDRL